MMERNDFRRELRLIFDQAEQHEELMAEVRELRADRDHWRKLAIERGTCAEVSNNNERQTWVKVIITDELLTSAVSTKAVVEHTVQKLYRDFKNNLEGRGLWR